MIAKYPLIFKQATVKRFLANPEMGIKKFSEENGLPSSCVGEWIVLAENGKLNENSEGRKRNAKTLLQKYDAILEYKILPPEEQRIWLRTNGISLTLIKRWEEEVRVGLGQFKRDGNKVDNERIKQLEKDLQKKDKALAEVTATLVAKKKLEILLNTLEEEK